MAFFSFFLFSFFTTIGVYHKSSKGQSGPKVRRKKRARRRRRWGKKVKGEKKGGLPEDFTVRQSRRNMHASLMVFRSFLLLALTQKSLDKVHELHRY